MKPVLSKSNTVMEITQFGTTGIEVSRLGFGDAPVGLANYIDRYDPGDEDIRQQMIAAIHRAVDLGITYFDTAPAYGRGLGERVYGEALAPIGKRVFVATKVLPSEWPMSCW